MAKFDLPFFLKPDDIALRTRSTATLKQGVDACLLIFILY